MPDQILGDSYEIVKTILIGYKKSGQQWDDYSKKLDSATQEILKRVFFECRCNGFFHPHVSNDAIVFDQAVRRTHKQEKYPLAPQDMRGT